jgi:hypothetical protein
MLVYKTSTDNCSQGLDNQEAVSSVHYTEYPTQPSAHCFQETDMASSLTSRLLQILYQVAKGRKGALTKYRSQ